MFCESACLLQSRRAQHRVIPSLSLWQEQNVQNDFLQIILNLGGEAELRKLHVKEEVASSSPLQKSWDTWPLLSLVTNAWSSLD
jgi:hypothetical protein